MQSRVGPPNPYPNSSILIKIMSFDDAKLTSIHKPFLISLSPILFIKFRYIDDRTCFANSSGFFFFPSFAVTQILN